MVDHPYWKQQSTDKPLFPDLEWSKPEQKAQRGRLGIIGGNKLGFMAVADSYSAALKTGVGEIRVLLPDDLKKAVPPMMTDVVFAPSNPSGGLAKDAITEMRAVGEWASGILMVGDNGKNSETAILYEDFLAGYTGPATITRDGIDLIMNSAQTLVERPNTLLVASFAQLQKLFSSVYYPIVLTFSMQLTNLVEALHKFTITYPTCVAVLHREMMVVAYDGQVTTAPFDQPMQIWRGITATNASVYWLWNTAKPLESVTTSLLV